MDNTQRKQVLIQLIKDAHFMDTDKVPTLTLDDIASQIISICGSKLDSMLTAKTTEMVTQLQIKKDELQAQLSNIEVKIANPIEAIIDTPVVEAVADTPVDTTPIKG